MVFALGLCLCGPAAMAQSPGGGSPDFKDTPSPEGPATRPGRNTVPRGDTISLRPKWELGEVTRYTLTQTSTTKLPTLDNSGTPVGNQTMVQRLGLALTPTKINPEGGATVEIKITSVKMTSTGGIMEFEFDSTKPTPPATPPGTPPAAPGQPAAPGGAERSMIDKMLSQMVGSTMVAEFDRDGNITKMSGGEAFASAATMAGVGGGGPSLFTSLTPRVTGNAEPKVGETWSNVTDLSTPLTGAVRMDVKHTLRSATQRDATIGFVGTMLPPSEGAINTADAVIRSASQQGTFVWDRQRGQLRSMSMDMKLEAQIAIVGGDPFTSATTTTIERVEEPAAPSRPAPGRKTP
jgi:hypothetical protein